MQPAYLSASFALVKRIIFFAALFLLLMSIPFAVSAQSGGGSGGSGGGGGGGGNGGGGGTPGDTFRYFILYNQDTCPLPDEVRADYVQIVFCGLGKRTNRPADFVLNVDGYTMLAPGTTRTINSIVPITLPCGNLSALTKFTESAFAQTSPPPPPYRLFTSTARITDTCR